jgi:hypothetical protein
MKSTIFATPKKCNKFIKASDLLGYSYKCYFILQMIHHETTDFLSLYPDTGGQHF